MYLLLRRIICKQNYGRVGSKEFTCKEKDEEKKKENTNRQCKEAIWSEEKLPFCRGKFNNVGQPGYKETLKQRYSKFFRPSPLTNTYIRDGEPMAHVRYLARGLIFAGTALETSYLALVQSPSSRVTNSSWTKMISQNRSKLFHLSFICFVTSPL